MTLIRPHALWLLVPVLGMYAYLVWRRKSDLRGWQSLVAPHLLPHLLVGAEERSGLRPVHLLGAVLVLATVAVAGPAWRHEPSPFAADQATLVVALDLSSSMQKKDVRPSRYERAIQKLRDLLEARSDARTGLVAYAGSAHLVLPPTRDPKLLTTFADALSPELMPKPGKNAAAAMALAEGLLERRGTVLFLTDGSVPPAQQANQVLVLAMAKGVSGPGTTVTELTVDDADVRRIARQVETHFITAQSDDPEGSWRDEGYWLTWPLLIFALFWFRKGWVVKWD